MAPIPKTIGRYDIIELVGRGGMGVLYRARDAMLERDVALKMMLVDFSVDPQARERFQREAKAVARLQHRNVVTIHELGEADGAPYIVMEFLSGQDLESLVQREKPLTLVEKLDIVSQLCEGLGYAHEQGIVHRDIKPGNVRVLEDGTVKILDFGIAKFAQSTVTQSGTILGTASYMAPEQIMGQQVDGRADLFSAGVLLHELLSGQKPFAADTPTAVVYQIMHVEPPPIRNLVPDLPEALDEIVAHALKKNPDERYSRASEMASDLQMVKMMLDLPLQGSESSPSTGSTTASGKLFATTIRQKTGATSAALKNAPIRPGAAEAVAVPEPAKAGGKNLLWAGIGAGVLVLGVGGYLMLGGGGDKTNQPPISNTGTPGPTGAPPSTGGTPAKAGTSTPAGPDLLVISSSPAGARIVLNGTDTGKVTPAAVSLGGKVPSTVELSLKGYQPLAGSVTDADVKTGSKDFRLTREAGPVRLTITGTYAFEIVQGSRVMSASATHHELTIQPGSGNVVARNKEYMLEWPVPIDFQRGQSDLTVPVPGVLAVFSAVETCSSVIVDGQDLGFPPIPRKPIAAGRHTVTIKCPGGKDETRTVTVIPGERLQVNFGKD